MLFQTQLPVSPLLQFGALGVFTAVLLVINWRMMKDFKRLVKESTTAMTKVAVSLAELKDLVRSGLMLTERRTFCPFRRLITNEEELDDLARAEVKRHGAKE